MPRSHPVSLQIADYLEFITSDLRDRKPSPRALASELDGLIDKLSFYANVCHSLTDQPLPARDLPVRSSPPPPPPRVEEKLNQLIWVTSVDGQTRRDIEEVARAIRVSELAEPVVAAYERLISRLQAATAKSGPIPALRTACDARRKPSAATAAPATKPGTSPTNSR